VHYVSPSVCADTQQIPGISVCKALCGKVHSNTSADVVSFISLKRPRARLIDRAIFWNRDDRKIGEQRSQGEFPNKPWKKKHLQ
jgi:hypothetical protein